MSFLASTRRGCGAKSVDSMGLHIVVLKVESAQRLFFASKVFPNMPKYSKLCSAHLVSIDAITCHIPWNNSCFLPTSPWIGWWLLVVLSHTFGKGGASIIQVSMPNCPIDILELLAHPLFLSFFGNNIAHWQKLISFRYPTHKLARNCRFELVCWDASDLQNNDQKTQAWNKVKLYTSQWAMTISNNSNNV